MEPVEGCADTSVQGGARPTWIVLQIHGLVPLKKGPFYTSKRVEEFLRDAYQLYPGCVCIVIDDFADAGWYPQHGYEWLDMYGDKRRRHPRKDEELNAPIGYLQHDGLAALKAGSVTLFKRRGVHANVPVYAFPANMREKCDDGQ